MPRNLRFCLLTTMLAGALAFPAGASAQGCGPVDELPNGSNTAQMSAATLCLVNEQRTAHGLGALAHDATLERTAQRYSDDMVARRYFSHTPPEGTSLQEKLRDYTTGVSGWLIGENLAWGEGALSSPRNTVTAWMNSTGHRANILNGDFREAGMGVTPGTPNGTTGGTYANHFGTRSGAGEAAAPAQPEGDRGLDAITSRKPASRAATSRSAKRSRCVRAAKRQRSVRSRRAALRRCTRLYSAKRTTKRTTRPTVTR